MSKAATLKKRRLFVAQMGQQGLLPGVKPTTVKEMLEQEARRPLFGQEKPMGADSLFGDGFKQKELFA